MENTYVPSVKAGKDVYGNFSIEIVFNPNKKKEGMVLFLAYVVIDNRTGFIHYHTENPLRYSYCKQIVAFLQEENRLIY
jgi:hypothetical protein